MPKENALAAHHLSLAKEVNERHAKLEGAVGLNNKEIDIV
jgi:hypothetical protein